MNIKKLLGKGYFPKELPPPFETISFAIKSQYIEKKWINLLKKKAIPTIIESANDAKKRFKTDYTNKYGNSKCLQYSLGKGIYSRRKLGIPNPKQYHDLSKLVVNNWSILRKTYDLTDFSASIPTETGAIRAVRTKSKSLNKFQFDLIEKSFNKRYELYLDITQFYPSIYTHSIPWAIMGKSEAKKMFNLKNSPGGGWAALLSTSPQAKLYAFCDSLDTLVRNCQERQSVGLPIGPDVSYILAEIIGNRIDHEIQKELKDLKYEGTRYYDDYYFYIDSYSDAEKILKVVQKILNEFQLETNESKVKIKELPFAFEARWTLALSAFHFRDVKNMKFVISFQPYFV